MTTLAANQKVEEPIWLPDLTKILTALASLVVGTYGFVRWWIPRHEARKEAKRTAGGLKSLGVCYEVMEHIVHHEASICDRAIILAGHNDGGYPTAASPYYVSALHWVTKTAETHRKINDYKNLRVDNAYCAMLSNVMKNDFVVLNTETMPDGLLREIYRAEGVSHCVICHLGIQDRKLLYLSCARLIDKPFSNVDVHDIRMAALKIKNEIGI